MTPEERIRVRTQGAIRAAQGKWDPNHLGHVLFGSEEKQKERERGFRQEQIRQAAIAAKRKLQKARRKSK
jgi:hypothetical protein